MEIRDWRDGDQVDHLLDADPDPLWAAQQHRFHGPPRDGERWRRTLIAEVDGQVVGAASLLFNDLHPGRYPAAVEVAPGFRRQGIGRRLLAALRELRPDPSHPIESKVRELDVEVRAFWTGAVTYQRCSCPVIDPADPSVQVWVAAQPDTARAVTDPAPHFATLYRWLHEDWSPVSSDEVLRRVADELSAEADLEHSSLGLVDGHPAALVLVFEDPSGWSCVAETIHRDEPGGEGALRAALARTLGRLDGPVEFDGHDSDPHLASILAELPWASSDPLLLIELA